MVKKGVKVKIDSRKGFKITGFILGVIGILLCLIPIINIFAIIISIIGLVFSIIAIRNSEKKGLAFAGLILNILAICIGIFILLLLGGIALLLHSAGYAGVSDVYNEFSNSTYALGPNNSTVVVIEFGDFQCPWCALASGWPLWVNINNSYSAKAPDLVGASRKVEQLAQQGKIKFIFIPVAFFNSQTNSSNKESTWAAEAAFCAADQGKFWQMYDAIFAASTGPEENTGKYSKTNLEIIAQRIQGLDVNKFDNCLGADIYAGVVAELNNYAYTKAGIRSTPVFYVNKQSVANSWIAIQNAINAG